MLDELFGSKSKLLEGKRILVCMTGSAAVLKTIELIREIIRHSGEPIVALSEAAQELVKPMLVEWAIGGVKGNVITKIGGGVEHVSLAIDKKAKVDLCVICPATANTISKVANGVADNTISLLTAAIIGAGIPLLIVPAGHEILFKNIFVAENIRKLETEGVQFAPPRVEERKAKIASLKTIISLIFDILRNDKSLKGVKVLITGGATWEYIDSVRFISNPSSGKTALSLAKAARKSGAEVSLVIGKGHTVDFNGFFTDFVVSANEMTEFTLEKVAKEKIDVLISAAAISDFHISGPTLNTKTSSKIKSLELSLVPTRKLIREAREKFPNLIIIGYKAEVNIPENELILLAENKLRENKLNMIIANDVGKENAGFQSDWNEIILIRPEKAPEHLNGSKMELAIQIMEVVSQLISTSP